MATNTSNHLSNPQLLKSGGAAVLSALVLTLAGRILLGIIIPLDASFPPFGLGPIIMFTVIFTLAGVGVLALVNFLSASPLKIYNIIGVVAFFLSIIPNLAGAANPAAMPMGGAGSNYLLLIIFHVLAAAGFLGALNLVARRA